MGKREQRLREMEAYKDNLERVPLLAVVDDEDDLGACVRGQRVSGSEEAEKRGEAGRRNGGGEGRQRR